jgi:hypothetical protein
MANTQDISQALLQLLKGSTQVNSILHGWYHQNLDPPSDSDKLTSQHVGLLR